METNLENMSKRKQEIRKTGFNFVKHTREESEANCPDYTRFFTPNLYMTEDELKYFKSDEQRELFKEKFWNKK